MLLVKCVLKICCKFTWEHPCRSVISIKLLCKVALGGCFRLYYRTSSLLFFKVFYHTIRLTRWEQLFWRSIFAEHLLQWLLLFIHQIAMINTFFFLQLKLLHSPSKHSSWWRHTEDILKTSWTTRTVCWAIDKSWQIDWRIEGTKTYGSILCGRTRLILKWMSKRKYRKDLLSFGFKKKPTKKV